ncbi:energy transducer TonB [Pontibacter sp. G13]|uniref:energy transducer TonB n=1 Tax=Pontibacter sp. G13 TaxID=3074898 RepID=UPI00288B31B0|nr:energy transducer TonB [Pontibacter sp. G13]WNJ18936.1 energy transducer TonB [Pontibacter sp. G13]
MVFQTNAIWTVSMLVMLAPAATMTPFGKELVGEAIETTETVYNESEVDERVVALNYEEVADYIGYPRTAKNAGIEGKVEVMVLVNEHGEVVEVKDPVDGHPLLAIPSEAGARFIQYRPAFKNGKAVKCWTTTTFDFVLP